MAGLWRDVARQLEIGRDELETLLAGVDDATLAAARDRRTIETLLVDLVNASAQRPAPGKRTRVEGHALWPTSPGKLTRFEVETARRIARPEPAHVIEQIRAALLDSDQGDAEPVSSSSSRADTNEDTVATAIRGVTGTGQRVPHFETIQRSFGVFDVSGVRAHVGGEATEAADAIDATAYAIGRDVAFASTPDLHTAAHEAAHVVQQRTGGSPDGGVGEDDDAYERHADAVADKVVAGESAEALLTRVAGVRGGRDVGRGQRPIVQRRGNRRRGRDHDFYDAVGRAEFIGDPHEPDGYLMWNFQHGSDRIDDNQKRMLQTVAHALKEDRSKSIEVIGHASAPGTDSRNLAISQARATSAETYLKSLGVDADRFVRVIGKGKTEPIAKINPRTKRERNARDAARNRRVEIRFATPPPGPDPLEGVGFEESDIERPSLRSKIPKGDDASPWADVSGLVAAAINTVLNSVLLEIAGPLLSLASIAGELNAVKEKQKRAAAIWGLRQANVRAFIKIELGAKRVDGRLLAAEVRDYFKSPRRLKWYAIGLTPEEAARLVYRVALYIPKPYNTALARAEQAFRKHLQGVKATTLAGYLHGNTEAALSETDATRARAEIFQKHVGRFRTKVANLVYRAIAHELPEPS